MGLLAALLMAVAATMFALSTVSQRWALQEKAKVLSIQPFLVSRFFGAVFISLFSLPFLNAWFGAFQWNTGLFVLSLVFTVVLNVVIQYANARASALAEASLVAPIGALTPGLVTIAAFSIGEWPTHVEKIGIILIGVSTYIHARENATTIREYLQPFTFLRLPANFQRLSADEQKRALNSRSALRASYLAAFLGTFGLLCDGLLARSGPIAVGIGAKWFLLAICFFFGSLGQMRSPRMFVREFTSLPARKGWFAVFAVSLCGLALGTGELLSAAAFRLAPVAIVGSLKRLTIPFTVIFAWRLLGEQKAVRRIWPALGVALGAGLLAFGGTAGKLIQTVEQGFR